MAGGGAPPPGAGADGARGPGGGPGRHRGRNPQIARQLSVSVSTVETHLERIYAKLGIGSRHELIAMAAARGDLPWDTGSAGVPSAVLRPPSAGNN